MPPLAPELRRDLERAVIAARETAESGAQNALVVLGVADDRAPGGLAAADRALRVALRAQARSLGGGLTFDGMAGLREVIAYGAWHRMLFARFLAENGLLVEPSSGAPVSPDDVAELAQESGEPDPWVLAARYAAAMLPGIFGTVDPTTQVAFAPDDRLRLEAILRDLPREVFTADDALGWVYQFWQSKRKAEVQRASTKIGGADLAPVTQLFTEHYMVRFLLENSLGAWWAGRHPGSPLLAEWPYLRLRDDGTPAAGPFEGWPERAVEVTVLDPCMGSGHFLVAAADMLRKMRIEEEGLTAETASEAVIRDNLFGLELDPRCTQIGAFALAFDAWRAAGGYRPLPAPNIACSGIAVKGQLDDWRRLAGDDWNLRVALERLYELFQDAPDLGSLIDPRAAAGQGLWAVDPEALLAALHRALAGESEDPAAAVFGAAAEGTAKAARLLAGRYWLIATNPPFLGGADFGPTLAAHVAAHYPFARHDLAYVLLVRGQASVLGGGAVAFVTPQAWAYLAYSRRLRQELLTHLCLDLFARVGTHGFDEVSGEVVNVALIVASAMPPKTTTIGLDASSGKSGSDKANLLRTASLSTIVLSAAMSDGAPLAFGEVGSGTRLSETAESAKGICTGDFPRFGRKWWEVPLNGRWAYSQTASSLTEPYVGRENALLWEGGDGALLEFVRLRLGGNVGAWIRGRTAWGRAGVAISRVSGLQATLYAGDLFDDSIGVLIPKNPDHLGALWAYCTSPEFARSVRAVNQKLSVDNTYLREVPFDLEHWTNVAAERYPGGLPEPHSDDPTQWLFKGTVAGSEAPLQVAVARLVGYRWPGQEPDGLDPFADPDGIVCLPPVGNEPPAAERLEKLLATAFGSAWRPAKRDELLAAAGSKTTTLETWLRDELFEQHARLFHNRPFIWHVWDGRRDGFSALLHYHRLDRATLEKLTYSHLADWLERQRAGIAAGEAGAEARLAAASELQRALAGILKGEPPYDIYVRWKPLAKQPVGWEPDLDDGVRLNIRPFVTAGILRAKFTISWSKDRGNDPDGSERLNDVHLTIAEKWAARQ